MKPQIRALLVLAVFIAPLAGCPSGTQGFAFVADVNGAYQPEGPIGSAVMVEGIQFGTIQGSSNLYFTNSLGGTALPATISVWNNTFIIGTVPVGAITGPISVNNGNGANLGLVSFTVTPPAPFDPTVLTWAASSALPVGLSGHAVAFTRIRGGSTRVIYVVGGANNAGTPQAAVYYSVIPALGALPAWSTTTPLPAGVAFHAAIFVTSGNSADTSKTGHLLVIGGATDAAGTPTDAIYRAALNADGSLGAWSQSGTLPAQLRSFGATMVMGHLYIVGGATTGNAPVATVYRAVIQPDGSIKSGDWMSQTSLSSPRARFGFGQFNNTLYVIGGDAGTHTPGDTTSSSAVATVAYAPVDLYSRNLLGGWTQNATGLPAARMAETAVVGGAPGAGKILVSAGVYAGAPSNEELYATIAANGSVSTFTAAANTLNTACSCNLFNHAATGYVNTNGEFHLLVIGGDDKATPGTKHVQAFTY